MGFHSEWTAWDWLEWHPDDGWQEQRGFGEHETKKYIGFGESLSPVLATSGIHICFLPKVKSLEKEVCEELSLKFSIPSMFWEKTGWDGNGYFWARPEVDGQALATVARLLVKEVKWDRNKKPDEWYDWMYFGFASFWQPPVAQDSGIPSTVFLVFDTSDEKGVSRSTMINQISRRLQKRTDLASLQLSPFGIYVLIMEPLLWFFDDSLWGFRDPVRSLEKNRLSTQTATRERYEEMHELSRHIIHASETIDAAATVLERMADCQIRCELDIDIMTSSSINHVATSGQVEATSTIVESRTECAALSKGSSGSRARENKDHLRWTVRKQIQEDLLFYANFFTSLKLRATAFEERLNNEIQLAHHTVAARESLLQENLLKAQEKTLGSSQGILSEMKNDGRNVAKLVSYLSIMFLPGSFFSGFFGMNVLAFAPTEGTPKETYWSKYGWQVSKLIWVPVSFIVIATVICWLIFSWSGLLQFIENVKSVDAEKDAKEDTHESE